MNRSLKTALVGTAFASTALITFTTAAQNAVTPAPDPAVGAAPPLPSNAQETYDETAIRQLMKIVELSRTIGGGISQIFSSAKDQKNALDLIRDAQTGPKEFPVLNGTTETNGRQGGAGLKEMADAALTGAVDGPDNLLSALSVFQTEYRLAKAFALKDDTSPGKQLVARASAQGAVAAATAEDSYKRANVSMVRLGGYITALQASADLKTSIDINTRVMIEVAQQINESLRTQAALASIGGTYFMILGAEAGADDTLAGMKNFNR